MIDRDKAKKFLKKWEKDSRNKTTNVYNNIKSYFASYGGFYELIISPYFIAAFIINTLMYENWTNNSWIDDVKIIIPSIIGFSLGAYAILVAFGSEGFQEFISLEIKEDGKEKDNTMYMQINTAFVHFISVQIISLTLALIGESWLSSEEYNIIEILCSFLCNFIFVYSLMLGLASVFVIFTVAKIYQAFNNRPKE